MQGNLFRFDPNPPTDQRLSIREAQGHVAQAAERLGEIQVTKPSGQGIECVRRCGLR